MKKFTDLIEIALENVKELFPWDLDEKFKNNEDMMLLDIREPYEFETLCIEGSINVPRGILETACEYDYEETVPELVQSRDKEIIVICRSGNRSALAAHTMQLLGYTNVLSLKTGLRGWNDFELPMVDKDGNTLDIDDADDYFDTKLRPDQLSANH